MTKDCYQIITDEPALKSFIEWLPEHSVEECYFYALFCRYEIESLCFNYSSANRIKEVFQQLRNSIPEITYD